MRRIGTGRHIEDAMTVGHRGQEAKPQAELNRMLGEGDTAQLAAKLVKLDTSHDVHYTGGVSIDGKTVYIDRQFHAELLAGTIAVRGMSARQVVRCLVDHEHTEKAIDDGDNPCDAYLPCHGFALRAEHDCVEAILGPDGPERYEAAIGPGIRRCAARTPTNPPRDLWCGPLLDEPSERDQEILRIYRRLGVDDAYKLSKLAVHYGVGAHECRACEHFSTTDRGVLRRCALVSGLVRGDRGCDRWAQK
jgi:hypothetical protein